MESIQLNNFKASAAMIEHKTSKVKPKDDYYLVHVLFLLFGIMTLLPVSFFVTANDYWMYKFRNTSTEIINTNEISVLQTNFASVSTVANSVPTIVCMLIFTIFGYKIKARTRVLISLAVLAGGLVLATAFIKINTDSWQTGFFALTMIILIIMNGILALFQVSALVLLSKFPEEYMKTFLNGQGLGGIFISSLQVISLMIGTTSEASALIYFTLGTSLTLFTMVLFYFSENLVFYQYYLEVNAEDTKRDVITIPEIKAISRKIWPCLVISMSCALAFVPTHPAIAALVVSEHHGKGYLWNDKYFVAVITFLFTDICSLVGRIWATTFKRTLKGSWLAAIGVARIFVFPPLFMFCYTLSRNHLPVLFPHDWQYIIILASFFISSGYLFAITFLKAERYAGEDKEHAYLIIQTCVAVVGAVFSPIGVVCANIL